MLEPTKHLDLDTCVLRVSGLALRELRKKRIVSVVDLLQSITSMVGDDAVVTFLPSVHLLYLLGRVEYHSKTDSLEFVSGSGR